MTSQCFRQFSKAQVSTIVLEQVSMILSFKKGRRQEKSEKVQNSQFIVKSHKILAQKELPLCFDEVLNRSQGFGPRMTSRQIRKFSYANS